MNFVDCWTIELFLLKPFSLGFAGPSFVWFDVVVAIFVSSILGSIHCVGMCGPFLAIATAPKTTAPKTLGSTAAGSSFSVESLSATRIRTDRSTYDRMSSGYALHVAYHIGRLTTYLALGVLASVAARLFNLSAEQLHAPKWLTLGGIVGAILLSIGFWKSSQLVQVPTEGLASKHDSKSLGHSYPTGLAATLSNFFRNWSQIVASLRHRLRSRSGVWNAYSWGLFTTMLPCGWLYIFVIAALASPNLFWALSTMLAFWLGTIPALSTMGVAWESLRQRLSWSQQMIATCVVLGLGIYLIGSRSIEFALPNERSANLIEVPPDSSSATDSAVSSPSPKNTEPASPTEYMERLLRAINAGSQHCGPQLPEPQ